MRNLAAAFIGVCAFLLIPIVVHAQSTETITSFNTAIQAHKDGTILVVERIKYNFGDEYRHGIIRNIPYTFKNIKGDRYKMDIQLESVTDEKEHPYNYSTSILVPSGGGENLSIKVGDGDRTISGEHTYIIAYTVRGAFRYFSDHDELYWNATGNEWPVSILQADAYVEFTTPIAQDSLKGICYTGSQGSTAQNCQMSLSDGKADFKTTMPLNSYEGMTFSASFPKGNIDVLEPQRLVYFWETTFGKLLIFLLAVAVVIGMVFWYILYPLWLPLKWFLYGRDPYVGKPVTAMFDAPKNKEGRALTAGETGTILDEKVDKRDISATIIQLAQRGYLEIKENKDNEFTLIKKKEFDSDKKLQPFEIKLLKGIFKGNDSRELKDAHLESTISSVSDELYDTLTKQGYFPENPQKIRTFYAVVMGFAGITFNLPLLITGTLFGLNMARKTIQGAQAATEAKGMKNFLNSQERQLNFQGEKQMMFEKLLPFAIAFGVEKNWIARFKDIDLKEPDWYHGYYSNGFQATYFTNSLTSSLSSISTAATPVVSSTGSSSGFSGGSSGGGGGGGGGGSW